MKGDKTDCSKYRGISLLSTLWSYPCVELIMHYAMEAYGGVSVWIHISWPPH
jgi:hypothetical protein